MKIDMFDNIICSIYRAVDQADAWNEITQQISCALGSEKFLFATRDKNTLDIKGKYHWSIGNDALDDYLSHYSDVDILSQNLLLSQRERFHSSQELYPDKMFLSSELYADFCRPYHIRHSMGVAFDIPESSLYTQFACLRDTKSGPFSEAEIAPWNRLVQHFKQFVYLKQKYQHMDIVARSTEQVIERFSVAAFLCDQDRRILYHNLPAESLLARSSIFTSNTDKLVFRRQHHKAIFTKLLRQAYSASAGTGTLSGGACYLNENDITVEVRAFPFNYRPEGVVDSPKNCVLVLAVDTTNDIEISANTIQQLYNLTSSEADICRLLIKGISLNEIADIRQSSQLTVRTQLRSINQKMEVSSQPGLISKILRGIARI